MLFRSRIIKHKWFFVAVEDMLFWIIAAVLIFRMMYRQNDGTIRAFSILGMTLGMIVYNQSLSKLVVKGITSIFLFINKWITKLFQVIAKPLRLLIRKIKKEQRIAKVKMKKAKERAVIKAKIKEKEKVQKNHL